MRCRKDSTSPPPRARWWSRPRLLCDANHWYSPQYWVQILAILTVGLFFYVWTRERGCARLSDGGRKSRSRERGRIKEGAGPVVYAACEAQEAAVFGEGIRRKAESYTGGRNSIRAMGKGLALDIMDKGTDLASAAAAQGKNLATYTKPVGRGLRSAVSTVGRRVGGSMGDRASCLENEFCETCCHDLAAARRSMWGIRLSSRLFYQLIMQKNPVDKLIGSDLPHDAHIRQSLSEQSISYFGSPKKGGSSGDCGGSSGSIGSQSSEGDGSEVSLTAARPNMLHEDAYMYLPPLVTTLLYSFCKDVTDQHTSAYLRGRDQSEGHQWKDVSSPSHHDQLDKKRWTTRNLVDGAGGVTSRMYEGAAAAGGASSAVTGRFGISTRERAVTAPCPTSSNLDDPSEASMASMTTAWRARAHGAELASSCDGRIGPIRRLRCRAGCRVRACQRLITI